MLSITSEQQLETFQFHKEYFGAPMLEKFLHAQIAITRYYILYTNFLTWYEIWGILFGKQTWSIIL